jgi:hypothetical protein
MKLHTDERWGDLGIHCCGLSDISSILNNGEFCFRFRDDSRGFQIEKQKNKLKLSAKWPKPGMFNILTSHHYLEREKISIYKKYIPSVSVK